MKQSISLIIPCYRDSVTLARAIDSVLIQTRTVNEIIVVNDCSPETTHIEQVLQAYPDVVYIKNRTNFGLAATRNKGVDVAKSQIVTFLDADDELHPQKIELQAQLLQNNFAVSTRVCLVYQGNKTKCQATYVSNPDYIDVNDSRHMLLSNQLTGASIMIHKKLFTKMGGYDSSLRSCEDFDLWLRLLDSGAKVRNILLPLYIYHFNSNGLSQNDLNISYWELEVLKKYFSSLKQHNGWCEIEKYVFAVWLLKHFVRAQKSNNKKLYEATKINVESLLINSSLIRMFIFLLRKTQVLKLYTFLSSFSRKVNLRV